MFYEDTEQGLSDEIINAFARHCSVVFKGCEYGRECNKSVLCDFCRTCCWLLDLELMKVCDRNMPYL